jgi:hypothetical protein
MLSSVERPIVGASALGRSGATLLHSSGLVQAVLPASDGNMCKRTIVVPQELGRTLFAPRRISGWRYRVTNSRPWWRTRPPGSAMSECIRGTAERRKTKCGGMAAGRHSVLIVPTRLANSTRLEPAEGSEAPIHGPVFEKHDECIEIRQSCPRNRDG